METAIFIRKVSVLCGYYARFKGREVRLEWSLSWKEVTLFVLVGCDGWNTFSVFLESFPVTSIFAS